LAEAGATTTALAAHPGATHTDLGTEGSGITNKLMAPSMMLGQSTESGADPLLRAATAADAVGGEFYGPRWLMRGRAVHETPSRRSRRRDDWLGLWELSERLTDMTPLFRAAER
jgi:hypothetical protein